MTYQEFVGTYLNKRDETGMYYSIDKIVQESGAPREQVMEYLDFSQQVNYLFVQKFGRAAEDYVLIFSWYVVQWEKGKLLVTP